MHNTELKMRSLLRLFDDKLTGQETTEILEYLDHNEWGIAFESLISIVIHERISIDLIIYNALEELKNAMEIEIRDGELNQIKQLIKNQI